nr:sulfate transporter [Raoultella sp. NCTC 9187]
MPKKEHRLTMVSTSTTSPRSGVYYFSQGWKLIGLPGIRRFVFLPLLVNIILMGGAFWWLFTRLDSWIPSLMSHVPEWLNWLNYLLWPVMVISILLVFGYFFSTIANWIAAPFSGLLAEQLEARLTGATPPDVGVFGIMKDVPRIMKREWQKFSWYLPRAHHSADPVLHSRHRPDRGTGAVVPVQRVDAGHSVLRLPV